MIRMGVLSALAGAALAAGWLTSNRTTHVDPDTAAPPQTAPRDDPPGQGAERTGAESTPQHRALLERFLRELVKITPGTDGFPATFTMGSDAGTAAEQPAHREPMTTPFWIARYEVPQNLYQAVMGDNPSRWKGPRNSAEQMTWKQAVEFCRRITRHLHAARLLDENEEIRLPTEVEWEYACRAGTTTAYSFGDRAQAPGDVAPRASVLDDYAWHTGNAAGNDPAVGSLKPNPWGLYDVHGYLWEFTADAWRPDYGASRRPADAKTQEIAIRGGSWRDPFPDLRSAARRKYDVTARSDAVGFRCVRARRVAQESSQD